MSRTYETVFVLDPTVADEEADRVVAAMEGTVKERGAGLKVDRWGKRRLAFEVKKHREGNFVLFTIDSNDGAAVHELERRLRIDEKVIRYLSVRVDEERRRALKLSKARGIPPPWERMPISLAEPVAPLPAAAAGGAESGEPAPEEEEG